MSNSTIPLRDLSLDGEGPAYQQIYRSICLAIRAGRAPAGARLPSSRWLAEDLAVSRNTVLAAYDQLRAEGYAVARSGSGTYVAPQLPGELQSPRRGWGGQAIQEIRAKALRTPAAPPLSRFGRRVASQRPRRAYDALAERGDVAIDFMPCVPGVGARSTDAWRRCVTRQLARSATHPSASALGEPLSYGDPAGVFELREEIADYLARSRGVDCGAEEILIVGGLAQALDICARLLLDEGDSVLLEDPHYIGARRAFGSVGAKTVGAPVDAEGANLREVAPEDLARCRLLYLTPAHQFPAGAVLSLRRRLEILEWARSQGAYLIEDDYDSEFRYAGRAIEALKSLDDSDRVIYVGTFSKVLDPALRIAYAVVPAALRGVFRDVKWLSDWASATFEQQVLALFMKSGDFERHLRRMRTLYARRRAALLRAVESELGAAARLHDSRAGLHVMVEIPGLSEASVPLMAARMLERGVAIYSASPYFLSPPATCHLILGFTLPDEDAIGRGVAILAEEVGALLASD